MVKKQVVKKVPISVFIIAKDEEVRITKTLKAVVGWASEVIVIDGGSTDDTVKIAKESGAKVIFNKWKGYGQQKIFGEKKCKNDWILNIDADEEVTDELKEEIDKLFEHKIIGKYLGYRVRIVNTFPDEKEPKSFAYFYNQLRLYNRKEAGFRNSSVHDSVIIDGVGERSKKEKRLIGQLEGEVNHWFIISLEHWISKLNRISNMQAVDAVEKGTRISVWKLVFAPIGGFLKAYFVRRYCIYGRRGVVYSYIYAFGRYMKYAKIIELKRGK
jgi:glycosyltransferase involved in cell wall biosynthesis